MIKINFIKTLLLSLSLLAITFSLHAQGVKSVPTISSFIKANAVIHKGMFNVYLQDEKYLIEIPDKLLGKDILTTISIISASAQRRRNPEMRFGFAGDAVNDRVIRFVKGNDRINIMAPLFSNELDSTSIYFNMVSTELQPALLAFDIIATGNASSLIDITALLAGDSDFFSLKGAAKELKLGVYEQQKSKIIGVSTFQNNVIFRTIKSYAAPMSASTPSPGTEADNKAEVTNPTIWEVGASWLLLPEKPMQKRYADKRIGYFQTTLKNYNNDGKNEEINIANRWRLEPKPQDVEKFKNGELVEPQTPIVFYIDRNMPKHLVPYVIDGVNAWQKCFEKIGFKNAIMAKLAPTAEEDPDYSMEDARYSYISYKPSAIANAYGPQIVDPRSGQILTSHIAVFHSILELLQRWYFSMCAATNPSAQTIPMDPKLIGSLLRNVITHEVGHTLGLRHNFTGSASYPVDSIRNRDFVHKNSFGSSVMDYMRFNYAAQPGDKMTPDDLLPVISVYDDFAIEWGYKYFPKTDEQITADYLSAWVSEKRKDPRCFYYEEGNKFDPRVQSEDIGDNNMKANALGVENLKKIMLNLETWASADDNYSTLRYMYRAVQGRYYIYLQHVVKNVGGILYDNALRSESKTDYAPVSRQQQKEAMKYLSDYLFTEPKWLYREDIMAKTKFNFDKDVEESYKDIFGRLMGKYAQLSSIRNIAGESEYPVVEFLTDLQQMVFKNIDSAGAISRYTRLFQRAFVNSMLMHVDGSTNLGNDISQTMTRLLLLTEEQARSAAKNNNDFISKSHLIAIADMIKLWYSEKNNTGLSK